MLIKKVAYWGAGFACGSAIFLVGAYVVNGFSINRIHPAHIKAGIRWDLHNIYLACRGYWSDTNPANACNEDIYSLTTYGFIQSANLVVWGKGGNQYDFNLKGKSRELDFVYSLEVKTVKSQSQDAPWKRDNIRQLENAELESALAEFNKLEGNNKTH